MAIEHAINQASEKAKALVEALSYIQRFQDKVIVVKVGGSIMDDEQALSAILTDIVFMNYVGMQPVLVHGGGKAINEAMEKAGLQPQWVQGRRYTDERTLAIAEHVLCNQINKFIVNFIQAQGCEAMGLHSLTSNVLFAEKTFLEGPEGRRIDLGLVGEVNSVNARLLQLLVQADSIPVIATIARDDAGGKVERQRGHRRRRGGGGDEGGKAGRRLRHPRHPHRRERPGHPRQPPDGRPDRRDGEERRHLQRHAAEGRGVRHRPQGGRHQDAHHRRPDPARAAAGDLHGSGDWN